MNKCLKIIRIRSWFSYLIPFYFGILFSTINVIKISFLESVTSIVCIFCILLFTASFGYILNETTDFKEDTLAGKRKKTEKLSLWMRITFLILLLILAFVPWTLLPVNTYNLGFFILQILLLLIYSVKPVRLKRFPVPAIITDALYNSVVMAFVIFSTFIQVASLNTKFEFFLTGLLFLVLFLKGLRGFLLHQIADRKNDRRAKLNTFVIRYGALCSSNLINKLLVPLEILLLVGLGMMLGKYIPGFIWLLATFLFYKALKLRFWNISDIIKWDYKYYRFIFQYTLNDFYEEWVPLYMLVLLSIRDVSYLYILIPFVLLFPSFFKKLYKDIPEAIVNFKSDFRNKFFG